MYKVDDNAVKYAVQTGLAALRPDRALSTYASMGTLAKETVQCITFDTLVQRNRVKRIDLLQIDTEGFDFEIIKMINFDRIKPRILQFEHRHLTKAGTPVASDCSRGKATPGSTCSTIPPRCSPSLEFAR